MTTYQIAYIELITQPGPVKYLGDPLFRESDIAKEILNHINISISEH